MAPLNENEINKFSPRKNVTPTIKKSPLQATNPERIDRATNTQEISELFSSNKTSDEYERLAFERDLLRKDAVYERELCEFLQVELNIVLDSIQASEESKESEISALQKEIILLKTNVIEERARTKRREDQILREQVSAFFGGESFTY